MNHLGMRGAVEFSGNSSRRRSYTSACVVNKQRVVRTSSAYSRFVPLTIYFLKAGRVRTNFTVLTFGFVIGSLQTFPAFFLFGLSFGEFRLPAAFRVPLCTTRCFWPFDHRDVQQPWHFLIFPPRNLCPRQTSSASLPACFL